MSLGNSVSVFPMQIDGYAQVKFWRFRAGGGQLTVEESVYLGADTVRRTEQLMVTGQVRDAPAEVAWVFEQIVV